MHMHMHETLAAVACTAAASTPCQARLGLLDLGGHTAARASLCERALPVHLSRHRHADSCSASCDREWEQHCGPSNCVRAAEWRELCMAASERYLCRLQPCAAWDARVSQLSAMAACHSCVSRLSVEGANQTPASALPGQRNLSDSAGTPGTCRRSPADTGRGTTLLSCDAVWRSATAHVGAFPAQSPPCHHLVGYAKRAPEAHCSPCATLATLRPPGQRSQQQPHALLLRSQRTWTCGRCALQC
jgi:hypothetical protein